MAKRMFLFSTGLVFVLCAWVAVQGQTLTARELFYGAKPAQKPAAAPRQQPANPGQQAKAPTPAATATAPQTPPTPQAPPPAPARAPAAQSQPVLISADYSALGLRYSVLRRTGPNQYVEVDADTNFRSGDGLRVSVESNEQAYLYIVTRGSSGTWSLLFPSSAIDNGNNHVQAHRRYEIPAQGQFTFNDPPGEERLFVVLSREPEPDLERLIYSLGRPGAAPNRPDQPKVLSVQALSLDDSVVGNLRRTVIARDLIFEKVDDDTSARKEKASYVVNGGSSGRVVADLSLKHNK